MKKKVPYIPFLHIHPDLKDEMMEAFVLFYDKQQYVLGEGVERFEKEYAKYNGVKHAIGTGNGHDALLIILKSLGIGKGDEVIIPAHTFIATALSVINADATAVLVDVDPGTFNIDPELIQEKITERTKAIVPVHLYGNPCDLDAILRIAAEHNLYVIEDNAQAIGATFKGKKTGSFGTMSFSSFYPTKNLGALGDGGIVTTDDRELAQKARSLRNYGRSAEGTYSLQGINSRLDELQAVLLSVKMRHIDRWNAERIEIAAIYQNELDQIDEIIIQHVPDDTKHVRHIFPVLCDRRDELRHHLKQNGVDTLIHYDYPIHFHPAFSFPHEKKGQFEVAEKICAQELSLPIYPGLKESEISYVCDQIRAFFTSGKFSPL